jgi:hypothetical protein
MMCVPAGNDFLKGKEEKMAATSPPKPIRDETTLDDDGTLQSTMKNG